jgi:hypothetical protein
MVITLWVRSLWNLKNLEKFVYVGWGTLESCKGNLMGDFGGRMLEDQIVDRNMKNKDSAHEVSCWELDGKCSCYILAKNLPYFVNSVRLN